MGERQQRGEAHTIIADEGLEAVRGVELDEAAALGHGAVVGVEQVRTGHLDAHVALVVKLTVLVVHAARGHVLVGAGGVGRHWQA